MQNRKIAVVVAAFNEASVIGKVIRSIPRFLADGSHLEVIVVDDASVDATAQESFEAGATVLQHVLNRGQGAALRTGFEYALLNDKDIVITFDGDGQHDAKFIPLLIQLLDEKKVDVVLGSRFLQGATAHNIRTSRRVLLKAGVFFTKMISRIQVTDTHNGLRAIRSSALKEMRLIQDRMEHASEILDQIAKHKLRFVEAPVDIYYSEYSVARGQSSMNALKIASKSIFHKLFQ